MVHTLKTWPEYFKEVIEGRKKFEVRKNDREFMVNDFIVLQEWDPVTKQFSGQEALFSITYLLRDAVEFGIREGYCVISLSPVDDIKPGIGRKDKFLTTQRQEHGYTE
jgi:hypothetical protein